MIQLTDNWLSEDLREASLGIRQKGVESLSAVMNGSCEGADFIGWFDYPKRRGFDECRNIAQSLESLGLDYDSVVVIGIGGSYLGTRAVSEALGHKYIGQVEAVHKPIYYCGHHLSEAELIETLDLLETKLPVVVVISKSGTTTEPGIAFRLVRRFLEEKFGLAEARRRIIAITDPEKGALREVAAQEKYLTFDIPADVGGRFSVLSPVGTVPLFLAGYDVDAMLTGAHQLFASCQDQDDLALQSHAAVAYACSRYAAFSQGFSVELLAYSEPKLAMFVEWWKQLFGESEGKDGKGIFPAGLAYTTDLHSLGQMAQDGVRCLLETFVVFDDALVSDGKGVERRLKVPHMSDNKDNLGYLETRYVGEVNAAAMKATKIAHFDGGVPCLEIKLPKLDASNLGILIAFFEVSCAIGGGLLEVNAFNQPGVEEYKKNLFGLLGKPGFEELGQRLRKRF